MDSLDVRSKALMPVARSRCWILICSTACDREDVALTLVSETLRLLGRPENTHSRCGARWRGVGRPSEGPCHHASRVCVCVLGRVGAHRLP